MPPIAAEMLTVDQLVLFLLFFIPGFIAVTVYDLFVPHERRDWQNALFEVVAYSTINFVVISALVVSGIGLHNLYAVLVNAPLKELTPLFWLSELQNLKTDIYSASITRVALLFVALIGMPALLSFTAYKARTWQPVKQLIHKDPMPTVWDSVFSYSYLPKNPDGHFVIVYLKEGDPIGGFYAGDSGASCYPNGNQIFLQTEFAVTDDGKLGNMVEGSAGVLICSSEIARIEFYDPV